jgi:hypothetical protein
MLRSTVSNVQSKRSGTNIAWTAEMSAIIISRAAEKARDEERLFRGRGDINVLAPAGEHIVPHVPGECDGPQAKMQAEGCRLRTCPSQNLT